MNAIADKGIAAHWSYKENYNLVDNSSSDPVNVTWLRDLVEILDSGGSSEELLEATKLEMFHETFLILWLQVTPQSFLRCLKFLLNLATK